MDYRWPPGSQASGGGGSHGMAIVKLDSDGAVVFTPAHWRYLRKQPTLAFSHVMRRTARRVQRDAMS